MSRRLWPYGRTLGSVLLEDVSEISEPFPGPLVPELLSNIFDDNVSPLDLLAGGPNCIGFRDCIPGCWRFLLLLPRVLSYLFERCENCLLPWFSFSRASSSLVAPRKSVQTLCTTPLRYVHQYWKYYHRKGLIINIPSKFSPGPSSNKCLFDEVDGEVNFVSALLDTANPTLVPASPMLL